MKGCGNMITEIYEIFWDEGDEIALEILEMLMEGK